MFAEDPFFDLPRARSRVKSRIVAKYFSGWANVILGSARQHGKMPSIAYVDLFCGPGAYRTGDPSTPILVLEEALKSPTACDALTSVFNDDTVGHTEDLRINISRLPGIERMRSAPKIYNFTVDRDIITRLSLPPKTPMLLFADPYGYQALSLDLIRSFLSAWGCDCIFFFNYLRVNMAVSNTTLPHENMASLFGAARFNQLRQDVENLRVQEREDAVMASLESALMEIGGRFVLKYQIQDRYGTRTHQYLVFVTKDPKGYDIMKPIMAKETTPKLRAMSRFGFCPALEHQGSLLEGLLPLTDDLCDDLISTFAGETLTVRDVFEQHNVGKPYVESNYKTALKGLEASGRITASPPVAERRADTMPDWVKVTFPRMGEE